MTRIPTGPLIVSTLIVLAGGLYLALRDSKSHVAGGELYQPPGPAVVRVAAWNIALAPSAGDPAARRAVEDHVGGILNRLHPTVVCLQQVASRRQAETIANSLTGQWAFETISANAQGTRLLTVLVRRSAKPLQRHLITLGEDRRALAYSVGWGGGLVNQFICTDMAAVTPSEQRRYLAQLLGWIEQHPGPLTVLAATFGDAADDLIIPRAEATALAGELAARNRLLERFVDCGPAGVATVGSRARADRIYASPKHVTIIRSAVVTGAAFPGMTHLPVVVDLKP